MYPDPGHVSAEAQRAEFEAVVQALGSSSRLARLLQYMGEKYFEGKIDDLQEYNIATEVLGRSQATFDPSQDALARVETHRLRKRLKEFYSSEGKDHPIQLSIAAGSYIPRFVRPGTSSPDSPSGSEMPESAAPSGGTGFLVARAVRSWKFGLLAVMLVLMGFGAYRLFRPGASLKEGQSDAKPVSGNVSPALPSDLPTPPIRILAGYADNPRMDSAGAMWSADNYFSGGGIWPRDPQPTARTSDPFIFGRWRTGDFYYKIPLSPGAYELHLFFLTTYSPDVVSTFSVRINGKLTLSAFDVNSDAFGENIADERVFRDVSPGEDGFLRIDFNAEKGPPVLNAIEVLPGLPHKQLPIRLIAQTSPLTDSRGQLWRPDNYFMNGRLSAQPLHVSAVRDPELFSGERYGHFSYAIPVDTRGRYTVVLHFAEFYFGPGASGRGGAGSRVFRVMCNGEMLLNDFDVFKEAGSSLHVVTKTFRHLKPTAQGKLNLTFEPVANNATVSAMEVTDESQ
jgi:hypothetical protein